MPATRLKEFLDKNKVKYISITHSPAYTAQEIAASAHVSGKDLAKTVVVKVDDKLALAVLPANKLVDARKLAQAIHANNVDLAHEKEFGDKFPECELGAMPPFGNLYDMPVYVDPKLAEDPQIAFNAGTHTELIRLDYADFEKLVKPKVVPLTV